MKPRTRHACRVAGSRGREGRGKGASRKIRTSDPRLRRPMLYPAELWTQNSKTTAEKRTRGLRGGAGLVKHPEKRKSSALGEVVRRRGEVAAHGLDRLPRPQEHSALPRPQEHSARRETRSQRRSDLVGVQRREGAPSARDARDVLGEGRRSWGTKHVRAASSRRAARLGCVRSQVLVTGSERKAKRNGRQSEAETSSKDAKTRRKRSERGRRKGKEGGEGKRRSAEAISQAGSPKEAK